MKTIMCETCGGVVVDGPQKHHHGKRCPSYKQDGVDHVVCRECGYRSPVLVKHIRLHGLDAKTYFEKYPGASLQLRSIVEKRNRANLGTHVKPIGERSDAVVCDKCGHTYLERFAKRHLEECVPSHPDKYVEGKDFVKCPECGCALLRLGQHMKLKHGWTNDRVTMEANKGLILTSSCVRDRWASGQDFDAIDKKRRATMVERYGVDNPFSSPEVREKIVETNQRRYGVNHPMQNEEVFTRQRESSENGPSAQEKFFDEHTCGNVVFCGYGGRFIRTKTGVHKYGRLVKDLNPDFIVLSSNVMDSALEASRDRKPMDRQKHRSRYVIELLGDYYHSEKVIGVKPEEHEREIVEAYKSARIECLVLWEKDVMTRWEAIRPMVDAWVEKAVMDMNENPIFSRATKSKVDRRKGDLIAPDGSGRKFRSRKQLDRWMASPLNYWKAGLVEGKDYILCLECGTRVSKVTEHLRKSHDGMTKEEYLTKHPGAPTVSQRMSESHIGKPRGEYVKRVAYRCPDGSIVGKKDAWIRAWGVETPPSDSIVDGSQFDPWKDKVEGIDYVACVHCGYRASNLSQHLRREHGGTDGYSGPIKSKRCVENLSAGANSTWDIRGRKVLESGMAVPVCQDGVNI